MQFHGQEVKRKKAIKVVNTTGTKFTVVFYALVKPNDLGEHFIAFYDARYTKGFGAWRLCGASS